MEITKYDEKIEKKILNFNIKFFSEKFNNKEDFWHFYFENPYNKNKTEHLFLLDERNEVIGQYLVVPSSICVSGSKNIDIYWGSNYIVVDKKAAFHSFMLVNNIVKNLNHFGSGFSKVAYNLHISLKERHVSNLYKYIYLHPFFVFKIIFGSFILKNKKSTLKSDFSIKNINFNLNKIPPNFENECWNKNIIEFYRGKEFIDWRFFYPNNPYNFYSAQISNNKHIYIVVKQLVWHGLNMLVLVDYRCDVNNHKEIKFVLKACKKIIKNRPIAGILFPNSLNSVSKKLRWNLFFKFGNPYQILTNIDEIYSSMDKSEIFVTFADSDIDFHI